MNYNNYTDNEYFEKLTHLVVILDSTAPSVCYYQANSKKKQMMSLEVLTQIVEFAKNHKIYLNFIYGLNELSSEVRSLIETTDHAKIIPFSLLKEIPEGVPVLQYTDKSNYDSLLPADGIQNMIVRVAKSNVKQFANEVPNLAGKVKRINLILDKLNTYSEKDVNLYKKSLAKIADTIRQTCEEGSPLEFNSITDRLVLNEMRNCDAGVTNLTVSPNGDWYVCPGFYYSNASILGNLNDGFQMKNQRLYDLQFAPICKECDSYHCKRCVYLNQKLTLEVNTPSHIQCVLSHKEREVSRILLRQLQESKMLLNVDPIPVLGYDDPFDVITGKKNKYPKYENNSEEEMMALNESEFRKESEEKCGNCESNSNQTLILIGKVTEEEKNEIKFLYERKSSLEELIQSLMKFNGKELQENALYERLIEDFTKVRTEFEKWWEKKADCYEWKKGKRGQFVINFDTCQVFNINLDL